MPKQLREVMITWKAGAEGLSVLLACVHLRDVCLCKGGERQEQRFWAEGSRYLWMVRWQNVGRASGQ